MEVIYDKNKDKIYLTEYNYTRLVPKNKISGLFNYIKNTNYKANFEFYELLKENGFNATETIEDLENDIAKIKVNLISEVWKGKYKKEISEMLKDYLKDSAEIEANKCNNDFLDDKLKELDNQIEDIKSGKIKLR